MFVLVHQESTSNAKKCGKDIQKRIYFSAAEQLSQRYSLLYNDDKYLESFYKKLRDGIVHSVEYKTDLKTEQDILLLNFKNIKIPEKDFCQVRDLYQSFSKEEIKVKKHNPPNTQKDKTCKIDIENFAISYNDYQFICECFINAYVNEYLNKR